MRDLLWLVLESLYFFLHQINHKLLIIDLFALFLDIVDLVKVYE